MNERIELTPLQSKSLQMARAQRDQAVAEAQSWYASVVADIFAEHDVEAPAAEVQVEVDRGGLPAAFVWVGDKAAVEGVA